MKLVWALSKPDNLGAQARDALTRSPFTVADPFPWWDKYVQRSNIPTLAIRTAHVRALAALPELHKDPFDRMLVAQAIAEGLTLVTKDAMLARYGALVVW